MKALVIGGTGLISVGIVKHLLARGAEVTLYNRGLRAGIPPPVRWIKGDRANRAAFEGTFEETRFDVVVDMICFTPEDAESSVRAFGGRCEQLVFCSTVCVYGTKISPSVLVDENFPAEPVSGYGRGKLASEGIFLRAMEKGRFNATVVRPSHTYGPGGPLVDQLELTGGAWDRIARGLPILCAGDGLGLWQSTHRDDCAKLFAHAALNPKTYGEIYNGIRDEVFTWRDYYRNGARALDTTATLVLAPAGWMLRALPHRFGFLRETTRFHGAYSASKARAHVPEFLPTIDFETGARETFADLRRRDAWRDSREDREHQELVDEAIRLGFEVVAA